MIKGNILLIDDDEDDQFIFKDILKEIHFPYDCRVAGDGLEAVSRLTDGEELPAIIFLDLNMPLMNGVEFLTHMKDHPSINRIPIVIFSTSNNPADRVKLPILGASLFITKTGDFKELKYKLTEILNDQQARTSCSIL
ncbi:MAG TPA: response regulator [Puia sp.]|jgi:CheY-like chemotaxis protein